MAKILSLFFAVSSLLAFAPILCLSSKSNYYGYLYPQFYDWSCPKAKDIVKSVVAKAVAREARMAASLLRLHFHDCFVKGCDASLLLDSSRTLISEKLSNTNRNSARGFEVIDEIKAALEMECPHTVSCADILALAARDSTVLAGGPSWEVPLGRRDSRDASLSGSNNNIPAPNNTFNTILTKFKLKGLDLVDLVTLSGSHTIGNARCTSFRRDSTINHQILVKKNQASLELVKLYAENNKIFFEQFAKSMVKMGHISPLTGYRGEIRKNCGKMNS
ncbi:unnamed protein product [Withania somnifera]